MEWGMRIHRSIETFLQELINLYYCNTLVLLKSMVNCDEYLDVGVETTPTPQLYYYSCGGVPN